MFKRSLSLLLSIFIVAFFPMPARAEDRVFKVQNAHGDIYAVGQKHLHGEIYLPLRSTCELLGYDVFWYEKDRSVIINGDNHTYTIQPGSRLCVTDRGTVPMIHAPEIIDGSTYAPLSMFLNIMDLQYIENRDILKMKSINEQAGAKIWNKVDVYRMMSNVRTFANKERLAGTKAENDTAVMLFNRFKELGYSVEQQPFKIYGNYLTVYPTVNRLELLGTAGSGYDTSVVLNSKNGSAKGQLVWYDETVNYKDKIVIIDTYNYLFYEYLDLIVKNGALAVIMLGESYENLMYGLYEEDKVVAIGVERTHMKDLRELVKNNVKVYAEIEVRGGVWYGISYNVIAKKPATGASNEILLVTAHYDTEKDSKGVNDNGSGIAVMLETAELLAGIPGDLEIWFVALSGNKRDQNGSNYLMSSLDKKTKNRIVGNINLDILADSNGTRFNMYTVDGRKNIISYFLERSAYKQYGEPLSVLNDMVGDHRTFSFADMPSVQLSQDRVYVQYYNREDTLGQLSMVYLEKAARVTVGAIYSMISKDTPSIRELDKGYNIMSKQSFDLSILASFPYGQTVKDVESELGIYGQLDPSTEGMAKLQYNIKWFNDLNTKTYFVYDYFGCLRSVEVHFINHSVEKSLEVLYERFGEPSDRSRTSFGWTSVYGNYYDFDHESNILSVYPYAPEDRIMGTYPVSQRIIKTTNGIHAKLWDLVTSVFRPQDIDYISRFSVFTDYLGNKTGYIKRDIPDYLKTDKTEFILFVDYYDLFDENGQFRNYNQTVRVLIHEYAHLLTLNKTQMDPEGTEERPMGYNSGSFKENSMVDTFYKQFWQDNIVLWKNMNVNDFYRRLSDEFVSKYAATKCSEDIAESFTEFVLRERPKGTSVAEEKILFFYQYNVMIDVRSHIREFLGLKP
ncbi:MAG TPA: hypothetical protein DDZ89_20555 [Clostridiales bacterium]|nr:hypothetical protein [Clostridiales bacterium]